DLCILKPPSVPSPNTGGGGNTSIYELFTAENFCRKESDMALADRSLLRRSADGVKRINRTPALDEFVNPLMDRPGNPTEAFTPGCFLAIFTICRNTSSERSSVAPFGN